MEPSSHLSHQQLVQIGKDDPVLKTKEELLHVLHERTDFEHDTEQMDVYLKNIKKKYYIILVLFLGAIMAAALMVVLDVYIRYGEIVKVYSKNREPSMPSGFDLGLSLRVPALASFFFQNVNFPNAVYISYYSSNFHDVFMCDPACNIASMYGLSLGGPGVASSGSGNMGALWLVCNGWANSSNSSCKKCDSSSLQALLRGNIACESPCPSGVGAYASDYASDAVGGISTGLMMGSSFGPEGAAIGAGVGALIGGGKCLATYFAGKKARSNCIGSSKGCTIM